MLILIISKLDTDMFIITISYRSVCLYLKLPIANVKCKLTRFIVSSCSRTSLIVQRSNRNKNFMDNI